MENLDFGGVFGHLNTPRGEGSGCSLALQFLAQSESLMADSMLGMQAIDMRLSDD